MKPETNTPAPPPPLAALVSKSPLFLKKLADELAKEGFETVLAHSAREFASHPRQRPFVVCFVDARGENGLKNLAHCRKARPSERYVAVRGSFCRADAENGGLFGCLCESYSAAELGALASHAAREERRARTSPPLEELLYDRFRDFLQYLGPASMKDLHSQISERVERPLLAAVMEWARGNQSKAADALGIHRNTLRTKLRVLGVSNRLGRAGDEED